MSSNLSLKLTAFEGPLDLLMHLIERDKIDIYDIPIVSITEQYIAYLRSMSEFDMEVASEFLVMAATLLQIKSRMLLPKEELAEGEEEDADPRQQLVEMLVEYRRIKRAAVEIMRSYSSFAAGSFVHSSRYFFSQYPIPFSEKWYSSDRLFIVRPSSRCIRTVLFLNSSS